MRKFITTEEKRRRINEVWRRLEREWLKPPNERNDDYCTALRLWIEEAVSYATDGADLPPFPKRTP